MRTLRGIISYYRSPARQPLVDVAAPQPNRQISRGFLRGTLLAFALLLFSAAGLPAAVSAATPAAPGWTLDDVATPTNFSPADNPGCLSTVFLSGPDAGRLCDTYRVIATNAGSQPTDGSPITLTDALPAGLTIQRISLSWQGPGATAFGISPDEDFGGSFCDIPTVTCTFPLPLEPDDQLLMSIALTVDDPGASGPLTTSATVSGGGAPGASATLHNQIASALPAFGADALRASILGPDGRPSTQAGAHPYAFTTRIDLANAFKQSPEGGLGDTAVKDLKDAVVDLPLGFLGSALATPTCSLAQFANGQPNGGPPGCPANTVVGHLATKPIAFDAADSEVWNLEPEHGVAAEFGFRDLLNGSHVLYARVVPGPDGYVLQVTAPDVPQVTLLNVLTTFYGDPAARNGTGNTPVAMFTNPANCSGQPLTTAVHMDSWQHPGSYNSDGTPDLSDPNWVTFTSDSPPITGCNLLHFAPTITVQPDSTSADSASGLDVEIKVPQSTDPAGLATPPLKKGVVTLPQGVSVNPAAADGLGACSPAQIDLASASEPTCPDSSKVGTVQLQSPLIPGTLTGSIFLATQNNNPFNSLLAGYIVVDDPQTGVVVKIPGNLTPDPVTGQITGVFDNNPQFPFSDLKLHFFGGNRGELATPETCGTYTTTSELTPWSAPDSGPPATPSDSFTINTGCVSGFTPSFTAGTTNPQAGAFSPFVLSLSRSDTDQNLQGLAVKLPPGMLAKLAGVQQCSEQQLASISSAQGTGAAQAANPSCPAASQLGTVTTGAGAGPDPFFLGGKAYLTGPYKGGPYGLAVVVPALAGPFDLGTVVVRQALYIDPTTAQVTAVSDPFPTILDGIPLRIRSVDVNLDRPSFTLNPTSCSPMAITGTLTSTGGLTALVSSRFQAGGCGELPFRPRFSASTQGKTSKANGASLTVKVAQKPGEANIHKVVLQLPIALPSRLTTLQKACTEAQFNANPAACPVGSFIGTAAAKTPVLNVPLTGPAILVSHGGAAFPDVEFILQGEGVKIVLDGKTDIKKGITYSRFETVPDAPISSFETVLPEGPHSVLAAFGNLCSSNLFSPTTITGQNGAVLKQDTAIQVTGCAQHISITKHKLVAGSVAVTLSTTLKGLVTITGAGLRKTSKTLAPGTHTVNVPFTARGRKERNRHRKITIKAALKVGKKAVTSTARLKL